MRKWTLFHVKPPERSEHPKRIRFPYLLVIHMTIKTYIVSGSSFCFSAKKMSRNPTNSFLSVFVGWHKAYRHFAGWHRACPYIADFYHAFFISFSKSDAKVRTFLQTRECFSVFLSSCLIFSSSISFL